MSLKSNDNNIKDKCLLITYITNLNKKKENLDTNYEILYIRKKGNPEVVMYDGSLIDDITKYISKEGRYFI